MKQYVASLSYGKDSLAMLHVITDVLHWQLDRIITADVWATDTIPADLPPMVEFKEKADRIIKERWGIEVEHVCAMRSFQMPLNVGGVQNAHTKTRCTKKFLKNDTKPDSVITKEKLHTMRMETNGYLDSHLHLEHGATAISKSAHLTRSEKITYESQFYRVITKSTKNNGKIWGFPFLGANWCNSGLKMKAIRDFGKALKVRWCNI